MAFTFRQDFLRDGGARPKPAATLAVFGKHPAWNDHMDDLGAFTPTLIEARRKLYTQGVATLIDTSAWERLAPEKLHPHFDNWLLWHRPGQTLVGRLLPSRDGKGRDKYPLVLLASVSGLPLVPALRAALPPLAALERAIPAATRDTAAAAVRTAMAELTAATAAAPDAPAPFAPDQRPQLDATGWARVLHGATEELSAYAPERPPAAALQGRHLRLPAIARATHPTDSLLWWVAVAVGQLRKDTPILCATHAAAATVDLIAGEPLPQNFLCLRLGDDAFKPLNTVPYNLSLAETTLAESFASASVLPRRSIFPPHGDLPDPLPLLTTRSGLASALSPGLLGALRRLF